MEKLSGTRKKFQILNHLRRILLIIPKIKKEGWLYLAGITSKNNGDSYCLNCLYFFRNKNMLRSHEKECKNKDIFGIVLPFKKKWINK